MPTIDEILRARREASLFDRVRGGSSSTAPVPTIFDRLAPSSPMQGITLGSILERGGQTVGRLGREVPNEIAANYADIVELARQNPGAFGPAALPITLSNIVRGYQQGQEREARGGEASLTETPFGTHTTGDPAVKGAAMIADPGNVVGTGIGAKIATGAAKLLGGAKGINQALIAFHGSPHKFDKFDMSKIGTGEGAQAYGHGAYLAENKDVAEGYKRVLGNRSFDVGGDKQIFASTGGASRVLDNQSKAATVAADFLDAAIDAQSVAPAQYATNRLRQHAKQYPEDAKVVDEALKHIADWQQAGGTQKLGHLYKVDLPDEQIAKMLDWDKPLSQQPANVLDALKRADLIDPKTGKMYPSADLGGSASGNLTGNGGADLYRSLARQWENEYGPDALLNINAANGQEAASLYLKSLGIPGLRYLDAGSRTGGKGTSNFVVFDPEHANILSRE